MEKDTIFIPTTMNAIKGSIITLFDQNSLVKNRDFKLRRDHKTSSTFELEIITKLTDPQKIKLHRERFIQIINEKFGESIIATLDENILFLYLDVNKEYENRNSPKLPETNESMVIKKKIGTAAPKNLLELQNDLIEQLQDCTKLKQGENDDGFTTEIKNNSLERSVLFTFKNQDLFWRALYLFEIGYADHIKVQPQQNSKWGFSISLNPVGIEVPVRISREIALQFSINLKVALHSISRHFNVLMPYLIMSEFGTKMIPIDFLEPGNAAEVLHQIQWIFDATRDGSVITIKVTEEQKLKGSIESITFPEHLLKKGLVTSNFKSTDPFAAYMPDTYGSFNYEEFNYLPFNRNRNKRHITEIRASTRIHGQLTFITVVETDCIDGVMKKWIVDGQHRYEAYKSEGLPIIYVLAKASTKLELIQLIARLNSTSKGWTSDNYLEAWAYFNEHDYDLVKKKRKETKLPLTLLLMIYAGTLNRKMVTKEFRDGRFVIKNLPKAEKYVQYITSIQGLVPNSRDIYLGFYSFIKNIPDEYDNARMIQRIEAANKNLPFKPGDELAEVSNIFEMIYCS